MDPQRQILRCRDRTKPSAHCLSRRVLVRPRPAKIGKDAVAEVIGDKPPRWWTTAATAS